MTKNKFTKKQLEYAELVKRRLLNEPNYLEIHVQILNQCMRNFGVSIKEVEHAFKKINSVIRTS